MRSRLGVLVLVLAFGLGARVGWWMVPAVAALYALVGRPGGFVAGRAALAAMIAWGAWLLVDGGLGGGALGRFLPGIAGALRLSPPVLVLVTLLFPALLAWSAAALVDTIRSGFRPSHGAEP